MSASQPNLSNLIQFEQEQVEVGKSGERYRCGSVTDKNIANTKLIQDAVFATNHSLHSSPQFLQTVLENGPEYNFLIHYNEFPVGLVCTKPVVESTTKTLHITSISVLKPYRNIGLGTKLIEKCKSIFSEKKLSKLQIDTKHALNQESLQKLLLAQEFQQGEDSIFVYPSAK